MAIGLVGRKCGMTRVFTEGGESIPVTVIEALPNRITQLKTADRDGYRAVQVTVGARKLDRVAKSQAGHQTGAAVYKESSAPRVWESQAGHHGGRDRLKTQN